MKIYYRELSSHYQPSSGHRETRTLIVEDEQGLKYHAGDLWREPGMSNWYLAQSWPDVSKPRPTYSEEEAIPTLLRRRLRRIDDQIAQLVGEYEVTSDALSSYLTAHPE